MLQSTKRKVLTIGLSGSSSAGKTSFCALLESVFPPVLERTSTKLALLHCDAYNKDFPELPRRESGFLDAGSRDSVHLDQVKAAIDEIKQTGELPRAGYRSIDFIEKDIQKARAKLEPGFADEMKHIVAKADINWSAFKTVAVIDGFLLYHDREIRKRLDILLFLRTSRAQARIRRFGRYNEGAAPEGSEEFWKTERYFDDLVWPTYVREHGFLFPSDDVEAEVHPAETKQHFGVLPAPRIDMGFEESMRWAVETILQEVLDLP